MWGNTLIVDRLQPSANQEDLRAKEEDKLVLTWEQRRWMSGPRSASAARRWKPWRKAEDVGHGLGSLESYSNAPGFHRAPRANCSYFDGIK